jgi:hypothetical protein
MREQVVEPDRRQRLAERLERHPMVAGRELELIEGDLVRAGERHARAPESQYGCRSGDCLPGARLGGTGGELFAIVKSTLLDPRL